MADRHPTTFWPPTCDSDKPKKRPNTHVMEDLVVTFVRHGESLANRKRVVQGQEGGQLTVRGAKQAAALAERLARPGGVRYARLICSDSHRVRQTAYPIVQELRLPYEFDVRLRERAAGSLLGKPLGTSEREARRQGVPVRQYRPPGGGESWNDVLARAKDFLQSLQGQSGPVLVVSHGRSSPPAVLPGRTDPRTDAMNACAIGGFVTVVRRPTLRRRAKSDAVFGSADSSKRSSIW